jgi:hypothetical protein
MYIRITNLLPSTLPIMGSYGLQEGESCPQYFHPNDWRQTTDASINEVFGSLVNLTYISTLDLLNAQIANITIVERLPKVRNSSYCHHCNQYFEFKRSRFYICMWSKGCH